MSMLLLGFLVRSERDTFRVSKSDTIMLAQERVRLETKLGSKNKDLQSLLYCNNILKIACQPTQVVANIQVQNLILLITSFIVH